MNRQLEFETIEQELQIGVRLGVASEDNGAPIGGGQMHIEHLDRSELLEDRASRESGSQIAQPARQGDLEAVCQEGDEDMSFDSFLGLMVDRTDGKIAFDGLEGFFNLGELDVKLPQSGGIFLLEVAA